MQDFEPLKPLNTNATLSDELAPLLIHITRNMRAFFWSIQIGTQCVPN
jgi:hypothetical protein